MRIPSVSGYVQKFSFRGPFVDVTLRQMFILSSSCSFFRYFRGLAVSILLLVALAGCSHRSSFPARRRHGPLLSAVRDDRRAQPAVGHRGRVGSSDGCFIAQGTLDSEHPIRRSDPGPQNRQDRPHHFVHDGNGRARAIHRLFRAVHEYRNLPVGRRRFRRAERGRLESTRTARGGPKWYDRFCLCAGSSPAGGPSPHRGRSRVRA